MKIHLITEHVLKDLEGLGQMKRNGQVLTMCGVKINERHGFEDKGKVTCKLCLGIDTHVSQDYSDPNWRINKYLKENGL